MLSPPLNFAQILLKFAQHSTVTAARAANLRPADGDIMLGGLLLNQCFEQGFVREVFHEVRNASGSVRAAPAGKTVPWVT